MNLYFASQDQDHSVFHCSKEKVMTEKSLQNSFSGLVTPEMQGFIIFYV